MRIEALPSLESRFALHRSASQRIKAAAKSFGLKQVPLQGSEAANGMTALYFPPNVTAGDLLPRMLKRGVVVAGGLHVDIKGQLSSIEIIPFCEGHVLNSSVLQILIFGSVIWVYRL